jgi:hypothetical protein
MKGFTPRDSPQQLSASIGRRRIAIRIDGCFDECAHDLVSSMLIYHLNVAAVHPTRSAALIASETEDPK